MKKCTKCGETKPRTEFSPDKRADGGRKSWCKSCCAAKNRAAHRADPNKNRESRLKCKYNITAQDYEELLCMCDAKCMICGMSARDHKANTGGFLCVDHDHKTGKVRGLLCRDCNTVLGKMHDDPDLFLKAHTYLINN